LQAADAARGALARRAAHLRVACRECGLQADAHARHGLRAKPPLPRSRSTAGWQRGAEVFHDRLHGDGTCDFPRRPAADAVGDKQHRAARGAGEPADHVLAEARLRDGKASLHGADEELVFVVWSSLARVRKPGRLDLNVTAVSLGGGWNHDGPHGAILTRAVRTCKSIGTSPGARRASGLRSVG
jgi:hypothetical protein